MINVLDILWPEVCGTVNVTRDRMTGARLVEYRHDLPLPRDLDAGCLASLPSGSLECLLFKFIPSSMHARLLPSNTEHGVGTAT